MEEKTTFLLNVGAQCIFKECKLKLVCVFCFGFSPLDKQLRQAILHLPTLELSIEMAQTNKKKQEQQQGKSPNNNKLWNRCPFSFQQ